MDREQILELTHAPDLLRAPELYGALILGCLIYNLRKNRKRYDDPTILFTASFAVTPFLLFNQQVVTGRSLQPFHYEEFAANYWVALAAVMLIELLSGSIPRRIYKYMTIAGLAVALMLSALTIRVMETSNIRFDQLRPVARKLTQQNANGLVFASDGFLTQTIPTNSKHPVLWARYLYAFSNVRSSEQKDRYYQYLYYSGFDESAFGQMLRDDVTAQWEIFGPERVNPILLTDYKPVTQDEIASETQKYGQFARSFDSKLAATPLLRYAVVSPKDDLTNLDRWYDRTDGQQSGEFVMYTLKLKTKPENQSVSTPR